MWYWERTSSPRYRRRHHRRNPLLTLIILGIVLGTVSSGAHWWPLLVILLLIIPMFASRRNPRWDERRDDQDYDDYGEVYDKPKRDFEKPKREPRYALGDDGELIELDEDDAAYDNDDKALYM